VCKSNIPSMGSSTGSDSFGACVLESTFDFMMMETCLLIYSLPERVQGNFVFATFYPEGRVLSTKRGDMLKVPRCHHLSGVDAYCPQKLTMSLLKSSGYSI
jgi:hypothetical protein